MKLRLILLFLLVAPAWAVPAFVINKSCGGANACTTVAVNTTGANFLVISITEFGGAPSTPTDSKSNTWNALTDRVNGSIHTRLFWSIPTSVGSGHTFTISDSGRFPGLTMGSWSGVIQSSPLDVQNGAGAAATTVQTGSITPVNNNSLIVSGCGTNTTSTNCTVNSGLATSFGIQGTGSNESSFMSYLVQSPAAAINPTWTDVNSTSMSAAIAAFKPLIATGNCAACDMSGKLERPKIR